jgi:hypothetical protein
MPAKPDTPAHPPFATVQQQLDHARAALTKDPSLRANYQPCGCGGGAICDGAILSRVAEHTEAECPNAGWEFPDVVGNLAVTDGDIPY